jgi:hypothetical protein
VRGEQFRDAIAELGFLTIRGDATPEDTYYVTAEPNQVREVARFELFEDGAFRRGVIGHRDLLSWPEFFAALEALKP